MTELELLRVVWALTHAKVYTTGNNKVTIHSEHSALLHLANKSLDTYVVYLKGKDNNVADCLSWCHKTNYCK